MCDYLGEATVPVFTIAQVIDDTMEADDTDGVTLFIVEGKLAVYHEAVGVFRCRGDLVEHGFATLHNLAVAFDVEIGAVSGEEVIVGFADGLQFVIGIAELAGAQIVEHEAPFLILNKETNIGQHIYQAQKGG